MEAWPVLLLHWGVSIALLVRLLLRPRARDFDLHHAPGSALLGDTLALAGALACTGVVWLWRSTQAQTPFKRYAVCAWLGASACFATIIIADSSYSARRTLETVALSIVLIEVVAWASNALTKWPRPHSEPVSPEI